MKTGIVLTYFILLINDLTLSDHCPNGPWVNVQGTCYYFSTQPLKWTEAVKQCQNLQSDLLLFYGEQDRLNFVQYIQSQSIITERWWTSLTDYHHSGIWNWGQGPAAVNAIGNSVVWNVEPDDSKHIENCGALSIQGTVSDENCSEKHGFICELPTNAKCPFGWMKTDTACYLFSDLTDPYNFLTWSKARDYCQNVLQQSGPQPHLIFFETANELTYIRNQLPEVNLTSEIWWIGMTDQAKENDWRWTDGTIVKQSNLIWSVEPNNLAGTEFCGMLYHNGRFADMPCNTLAPYVCQTQQMGDTPSLTQLGCPPNWLRAGHKCYYFNVNTSYTWQNASSLCQQRQSTLINIKSPDERHWLEFESRRYFGVPFWSGLTYNQKSKQWHWSQGALADTALVHWDSEPNDFDGKEDCAYIFQDGTYNDFPCFYSVGFACELQSEDAPCPNGWIPSFDEGSFSCYYISNTSQSDLATWYEARDKCVTLSAPLDGYLLAVNSQEEMDYVTQLFQQKPHTALGWWTGLNDLQTEGQWLYDTSFNNPIPDGVIKWNSEPNNRGGHDFCALVYYGGRYNDVDCGDLSGYICQMDASTSLNVSSNGSNLQPRILLIILLYLLILFTYMWISSYYL